jgi:hypothetical protein
MKRNLLLFLAISSVAFMSSAIIPADREVKGIVMDAYKKPIAGVNVLQKSTSNATVTNHNGEFSITIPDQEVALLFAFTGYKTFEVSVKPDNSNGKLYEVVMFAKTHLGKKKGTVRVVRLSSR